MFCGILVMSLISACADGFVFDHNLFVANSFKSTEIPCGFLELLPKTVQDVPSRMSKQAVNLELTFPEISPNICAIQQSPKCQPCNLRYKTNLFAIEIPFMMDSQFEALLRQHASVASHTLDSDPKNMEQIKRRKRKKPGRFESSSDDKELVRKFTAILDSSSNLWPATRPLTEMDNNLASRAIAALFTLNESSLESGQMFQNYQPKIVEHNGQLYAIPSKCRYISSLYSDITCLLQDSVKYDLIVIDPPWENKSAKRLKTYAYLNDTDFLTMPIPQLANPGALIALWITNNSRLHSFVENQLFPAWGVEKEAEWTWMKVTKSGEPVYPLGSLHKKPFEKLIFGRIGGRTGLPVPDGLVIVSVPSAIHSHKPPLSVALQPYVRDGSQCLELFARSLTSGWTSWGLEVLKLQNLSLFERV